jgi:carboxyl-terminal processing protease
MKNYSALLKSLLLLSLMLGSFFLGSAYMGSRLQSSTNPWSGFNSDLFVEVRNILTKDYLADINWKNVFYGMIGGMVKGLGDPYSEYFTPTEAAMFWDDLNGNFEGIGVEICSQRPECAAGFDSSKLTGGKSGFESR